MKLLKFHEIFEKGMGWRHEGLVEFEPGVVAVLIDDTNTREAYSHSKIEKKLIDDAMDRFAFGASHFPAHAQDAEESGCDMELDGELIYDEFVG